MKHFLVMALLTFILPGDALVVQSWKVGSGLVESHDVVVNLDCDQSRSFSQTIRGASGQVDYRLRAKEASPCQGNEPSTLGWCVSLMQENGPDLLRPTNDPEQDYITPEDIPGCFHIDSDGFDLWLPVRRIIVVEAFQVALEASSATYAKSGKLSSMKIAVSIRNRKETTN